MKFAKAIQRRFGIAAPRMSVRTHIAWYWRWFWMGVMLAVSLALAYMIYDVGGKLAGFERGETKQELEELTKINKQLKQENASLRAATTANERQLQIEQATQDDLAKHANMLQDENTRLKEDLSFFRGLMSVGGKEGEVKVRSFKVERGLLPGEYRYRLLLLQSGQRDHEFVGTLQLVVNVIQNGKPSVLIIPDGKDKKAQSLNLNFKYYQRVDGTFQLAPGTIVKNVQVRVFQRASNQPVLTQTLPAL